MPKNIFRIAKAIIFLLAAIPACSSAQVNEIITDRPDQTESPFTVPRRHFQMETGLVFEKTNSNTETFVYPATLIKYGLNDRFELRLIMEFSTINTTHESISGLNPLAVGFKVNITEEKGIIPKTSFIGHLVIPDLATEKLQATYYAPTFRFTMQNTLTKKISIGYNLGVEWDGEQTQPVFIYTVTTGYSITDKVGAYIELYGFVLQKSKADHRLDGGFSYLVRRNILIDISGGIGITQNAPKYYLACGFSFRLKD